MARVTVEDCILKVPNRFDLVALAAQRARDISGGSPLTVDRDRDKNPVVALREIAEGTIRTDHLREQLIEGLQKHVESDIPEEELEQFDEGFAPELVGAEPPARPEAEEEAEDGDVDLAALAKGLAAEAGEFRDRETD